MAVAVVEPGLNKSHVRGLSAATKKKDHCGEVAVWGDSTVEMLFSNFILGLTLAVVSTPPSEVFLSFFFP